MLSVIMLARISHAKRTASIVEYNSTLYGIGYALGYGIGYALGYGIRCALGVCSTNVIYQLYSAESSIVRSSPLYPKTSSKPLSKAFDTRNVALICSE